MASSSSVSETPERNAQLLSVGKKCSDPLCHLVDFLPFKCHHCQQSFCQEHFKVDAHKCPKYDESQHNRVAPNCPLCNTPIAIRPGQDPNIRMDQHLERECSVVTGKAQSKSTPVCARPSCKKVLFAPIRCDKCRQQFCPAHRFPGDHTCTPQSAASSSAPTAQLNLLSRFDAGAKGFATKTSAATSAAVSSVKKVAPAGSKPLLQAPKIMSKASSSSSSTPSNSSTSTKKAPLPLSKTDRLSPFFSISSLTNPTTTSTTNTLTNAMTSTNSTPPPNDNNKPTHMIDSLAFVPPPLFASA